MWRIALAVAALAGCGRRGFDANDGGGDGGGSADADPAASRVAVALGWTVRTLVDLTGVVPYRPDDFQNGTDETLDNAPGTVAALYAPFTASLAVGAGRSIIEIAADGSTIVHDYRPAIPDTTGPDDISHMAFGAPSDTGPALWIGSSTQGLGDGIFYALPGTWQLVIDNNTNLYNNLNGIGFDATGAFDGTGTPAIYFNDTAGVFRRTGPTTSTQVSDVTDFDYMAVTATALFMNEDPGTGPIALVRLFAGTGELQTIASSTLMVVAEGSSPTTTSTTAVRDESVLAIYANDGTSQDLATSTDPTWQFVAASVPQPPHALAGSYIVLESNRTLDRDDLLLVSPM